MCLLTIPNFGIIGKVAVLVCEFVILLVSPRASDYTQGRGACLMPCLATMLQIAVDALAAGVVCRGVIVLDSQNYF